MDHNLREYNPETMGLTDIWRLLYHARCRLMEPEQNDAAKQAFEILWEAQDAVTQRRPPDWGKIQYANRVEQEGPTYADRREVCREAKPAGQPVLTPRQKHC